jgi:hypothetical protein
MGVRGPHAQIDPRKLRYVVLMRSSGLHFNLRPLRRRLTGTFLTQLDACACDEARRLMLRPIGAGAKRA